MNKIIPICIFLMFTLLFVSGCDEEVAKRLGLAKNDDLVKDGGLQSMDQVGIDDELGGIPEELEEVEISIDEIYERGGIRLERPDGPRRDDPVVIEECGVVIEEEGEYILEEDLDCRGMEEDIPAIIISADNVDLDCGGNSMIGNHIGRYIYYEGIYLYRRNSNIISNCDISGFSDGIKLWHSNENTITGNTLNNNFVGIDLSNSDENTITENTLNENENDGIHLYYSDLNTITGNTACNNENYDIYINRRQREFSDQQCDNIVENNYGYRCERECNEQYEHTIQLEGGWNIISSYVIPYSLNIEDIFSELVDSNQLIMAKDEYGNFYLPEYDFNNIPDWNPTRGYKVRVGENTELIIEGDEPTPKIINLRLGWNIIAYPSDEERVMDGEEGIIAQVFQPLVDRDIHLRVKNERGDFYDSEQDFNNIYEMISGEGYQVYTSGEDVELDFSVLE